MNTNIAMRNVVLFEDALIEHQEKEDDKEYIYQFVETVAKREKARALRDVDGIAKNRITELEDKCMRQELKLQNCIPFHIITYLVINAIVVTVAMVLLVLRLAYNLYSIDPYYLICTLGIGTTLFMTAVVSLKEWKGFLNSR